MAKNTKKAKDAAKEAWDQAVIDRFTSDPSGIHWISEPPKPPKNGKNTKKK